MILFYDDETCSESNLVSALSSGNTCHVFLIFLSVLSVCVSQPVPPGSEAGNTYSVRWRPAGAVRITRYQKITCFLWGNLDIHWLVMHTHLSFHTLNYSKELTHSLLFSFLKFMNQNNEPSLTCQQLFCHHILIFLPPAETERRFTPLSSPPNPFRPP